MLLTNRRVNHFDGFYAFKIRFTVTQCIRMYFKVFQHSTET